MKENHREILVVSNAKGKKFSLIETDNNYIVACYYHLSKKWGEQWGHGNYFSFNNKEEKIIALEEATHRLRIKADIYIQKMKSQRLCTMRDVQEFLWIVYLKTKSCTMYMIIGMSKGGNIYENIQSCAEMF